MASNQKPFLPVTSLLLAATCWGVTWYPLRMLEQAGLHGLWATLLIYGSMVLGTAFLLPRCWREFCQHPQLFALIAVGSAWCNVAFFLAVLEGNVVRMLLLFYLSPVWATLMAWAWLKEDLDSKAWVTFFVAMGGALIMLWNPSLGLPWPTDRADLFALSSGMAFAFSNVAVRRLEAASVLSKVLANWWGVALLALAWIILYRLPNPGLGLVLYSVTAVFGSLLVVVMSVSVTYGVSRLPLHQSAVILLFELVAGTISSLWLTDEVITLGEWVGGALIVSAAFFTAKRVQAD